MHKDPKGGTVVPYEQFKQRLGSPLAEKPAQDGGDVLKRSRPVFSALHADRLLYEAMNSDDAETRLGCVKELTNRKDWSRLLTCMKWVQKDSSDAAFESLRKLLREGWDDLYMLYLEPTELRWQIIKVLESEFDYLLSAKKRWGLNLLVGHSENPDIRMKALDFYIHGKDVDDLAGFAVLCIFPDIKRRCVEVLAPEFKRFARKKNFDMVKAFAYYSEDAELRKKAMKALYKMDLKDILQRLARLSEHEEDKKYAQELADKM